LKTLRIIDLRNEMLYFKDFFEQGG